MFNNHWSGSPIHTDHTLKFKPSPNIWSEETLWNYVNVFVESMETFIRNAVAQNKYTVCTLNPKLSHLNLKVQYTVQTVNWCWRTVQMCIEMRMKFESAWKEYSIFSFSFRYVISSLLILSFNVFKNLLWETFIFLQIFVLTWKNTKSTKGFSV